MIEKVIKRNGNLVKYNREKIKNAIISAKLETNEEIDDIEELIDSIELHIVEEFSEDTPPTVEEIQDIVEKKLMEFDYHKIAKRYIIYREKRAEKRNKWLEGDLAISIWERKYRFNNESIEEFLDRVSGGNNKIRKHIKNKYFMPAGRILANRGLSKYGKKVTYSNCYVISQPEDSIESIFEASKKLARTFSYGGGAGIQISNLRPRGSSVNNAAEVTTGAVSFMPLYSLTTDIIGQNSRRGALMISIDIEHPDIEEFIDIKNDLDKVTKANISLQITNEFMEAVKNDENFELTFYVEDTGEKITKTVDANRIFNKIAYSNWRVAEPGFLYWDRIENYNLLSENEEFKYAGVNPCAEEPLPNGGSCLLSSLNLSAFVNNEFTEDAKFNFNKFKEVVSDAVIYLNEVLDEGLPLHPLKEQRDSVEKWRQIGLGIMGLADLMIKMGIKYGSEESLKLSKNIGRTMVNQALKTSAKLAKENGTYPKYKENVLESNFIKEIADNDTIELIKEHGLRNSQLLTIAPTGSISSMLNISGGIEPIFDISYKRTTETLHNEDVEYEVYTKIVEKYMNSHNINDKENLPEFFVTAHSLDYKDRIDMQSTWQKYIDASISSTINLDNSSTIEDIKEIYMYGWEQGLKGVTIYRDGCAKEGILNTDSNEEKKKEMTTFELVEQGICPECKGKLINTGGCQECKSCGYSPCSV